MDKQKNKINMFISKVRFYWPTIKRLMKQKIIAFVEKVFDDKHYMKNVFKKAYDKRVLIYYLTEGYLHPNNIPKSHTNYTEAFMAGKCFDALGYCVDVMDIGCRKNVDFSRYDVLYQAGVSSNVGDIFRSMKPDSIKIAYSPGAHTVYNNLHSTERVKEVYQKTGRWMPSSHRCSGMQGWTYYNHLSDYSIVLGNEFTVNTYLEYDNRKDRYFTMPLFFFDVHTPDLQKKDYASARRNFLWFGSLGLIHKGLDICLDLFLKRTDINLHICGASWQEKEFRNYYDPLIRKANNIFRYRYIAIESIDFQNMLQRCAFVIVPSVSEGGAGATLQVVGNGGLIPIYSKQCGLDFSHFGIEVNDVKTSLFDDALEKALTFSEEELKERHITGMNVVRKIHSLSRYEENLKHIIKAIVDKQP
jgi:hypothetical protein